jgi:hypothetical protein
VSKAWRESYERVASVEVNSLVRRSLDKRAELHLITPRMTLCSAVFASSALVRLACASGLFNNSSRKLQHIAGRTADMRALRIAQELGLQLTSNVIVGAAESDTVLNLHWLHKLQGCPLPQGICDWAAKSGSISTLKWLQQHGSASTANTCTGAAACAHVRVLQFLRDEGCECDESACKAAARNAHMPTLKWLHEHGCPWFADCICADAAAGGSIEELLYLKQQGGILNEYTLTRAARKGQLAVCEFLVAEQCPCDVRACERAAAAGFLEIVRFLHESGCPWEAGSVCERAAESGNVELLQYLWQQGCAFNAQVMSTAAAKGHTQLCEFLRAEQCPWNTFACRYATDYGHLDTLRWLHEHGCPNDIEVDRVGAAAFGHLSIVRYMQA